jgi:hypothetical protein
MNGRISRTILVLLPAFVVFLGSELATQTATPRFFADDPITREPDSQDASGVQRWRVDLAFDLLWNLFGHPGERATNVRALNVNTIDEVPDGSWFMNRLGVREVTAEEVARGPNVGGGPEDGNWTVVESKTDGVTPGFTVRDRNGTLWFLKFDPPGYRGMTTGTEVVVTKLMWALGYHTPENYIAKLFRDRLTIREGATFELPGRPQREMGIHDIDDLLDRADRDPDGSYRVVASRGLPGKPVGPFRFYDTRPDDPNDVVAHEHRRELRGLAVFAAWVNHVDAKSGNSLDTLITEDGRGRVRHHLIDFGSTLGSGSLEPRHHWEGYEYMVERGQIGRRMFLLGFPLEEWRTVKYDGTSEIGRIPADRSNWNPDEWKPRVPNAAFVRTRADDRFWAARKLAAMSDEMITAAVRTGEFSNPESEKILVRALIDRRDAILRAYLPPVNPIVDPELTDGVLRFKNAAVEARAAEAPSGYRAVWHRFDNTTGEVTKIDETDGSATQLKAPAKLPDGRGSYIRVDVSATGGAHKSWEQPVRFYFRRDGGRWKLVGVYRVEEEGPSSDRLRFG